jgi:hypothetical protein
MWWIPRDFCILESKSLNVSCNVLGLEAFLTFGCWILLWPWLLECTLCGLLYVGETRQTLQITWIVYIKPCEVYVASIRNRELKLKLLNFSSHFKNNIQNSWNQLNNWTKSSLNASDSTRSFPYLFVKERNELTIVMFIQFSFYYFLLETKF